MNLNQLFPDPRYTPHDEERTHELQSELNFLQPTRYPWVDEDGRIFIDTIGPLTDDERNGVASVGYIVPLQPTIMGMRVQYKLTKVSRPGQNAG